jgi:hypothetical protein
MLSKVISKTNWELLRNQKEWLWNQESDEAIGLVHFLDAIQDAAVEDGIATELEVFGELTDEQI